METPDEKLYEEAEARVGFKRHLRFYLAINILIWLMWYFLWARHGNYQGFWPVWSSLGWGIGVFSHYLGVYGRNQDAIEEEYEKLKKKRNAQ